MGCHAAVLATGAVAARRLRGQPLCGGCPFAQLIEVPAYRSNCGLQEPQVVDLPRSLSRLSLLLFELVLELLQLGCLRPDLFQLAQLPLNFSQLELNAFALGK